MKHPIAVIAGLILNLSLSSLAQAQTEPISLDQVLQLARERNPDILSARKSLDAARARIAPARAWPDPLLSITREKDPGGERMDHLMVAQDVPFPAKKRTEGAMKHHEALIAEASYRAKTLQVLSEARILYHRLYRADQMIRQLSQNVEVMKTTLRVSQSRLQSPKAGGPSAIQGQGMSMGSSGQTMGTDAFSLMTELGQMENMLFQEKQMRTMTVYELNALLDRDLETPMGHASAPDLKEIPQTLPALLKLTEQNGPMYISALHEQRHARAMLTRARLGFAPDFGVTYDRMTASDGMKGHEAGVRLTVPLWLSRPLGEVKEANAHLQEAEAMAKAMRNEAFKMVSMEFTETTTHLTLARNYRDSIVPSAESAFNLARRQYESGSGNYPRLLESIRTLISVQSDYYNELYHYGEHWALLEQWVGAPLSSPSAPQENRHD